MSGSRRRLAACRPMPWQGPSGEKLSGKSRKLQKDERTHLDKADPVFVITIVRDEHLRHPRHVIIKVIHVLDFHRIEESIRLRKIGRTTEPIGWRQHRLRLWSWERHATTDVRGSPVGILEPPRLPAVRRRCSGKRRRRTGTRVLWGVGSRGRDGAGDGRWGARSVPIHGGLPGKGRRGARPWAIHPCGRAHGVGGRSPGARQDGLFRMAGRWTTERRRRTVRISPVPRWRIVRVRIPWRISCTCTYLGRWRCDRGLIRRS
jgi:hypothetical protein